MTRYLYDNNDEAVSVLIHALFFARIVKRFLSVVKRRNGGRPLSQ